MEFYQLSESQTLNSLEINLNQFPQFYDSNFLEVCTNYIGGGMGVARGPWPHLKFGGEANIRFFLHISHILECGPVGVSKRKKKKRGKKEKKKKIELLLILSKFIL